MEKPPSFALSSDCESELTPYMQFGPGVVGEGEISTLWLTCGKRAKKNCNLVQHIVLHLDVTTDKMNLITISEIRLNHTYILHAVRNRQN